MRSYLVVVSVALTCHIIDIDESPKVYFNDKASKRIQSSPQSPRQKDREGHNQDNQLVFAPNRPQRGEFRSDMINKALPARLYCPASPNSVSSSLITPLWPSSPTACFCAGPLVSTAGAALAGTNSASTE